MTADVLRYSAFTRDGLGGNPAGVVLDAEGLSADEMLQIARAEGFSETAFLTQPAQGDPHLTMRFFSPTAEVDLCGHAIVAAAVAVAEREGPAVRQFATRAGVVSVTTIRDRGHLTATFTSPETRTWPIGAAALDRALVSYGLMISQLDPRYRAAVAFAGEKHLMLGVQDSETLAGLTYDYGSLADLMETEGWTTVHAFSVTSADRFEARNAFPPGGVVEDAATGAAAAAFGAYLRDLRLVQPPRRIEIQQGHHMGRPSRLLVDIDATLRVKVTGAAVQI